MRGDFARSFGLVIAFLCPGFIALWGASAFSPTLTEWFGVTARENISVGGFLFVLVGSLAAGVFVSGIRAVVLDGLYEKDLATQAWLPKRAARVLERLWFPRKIFRGLHPLNIDEERLKDEGLFRAYTRVVEGFWRYFQFYGNMAVAVPIGYFSWHIANHKSMIRPGIFILFAVSEIVLLISAGDSLETYCRKATQLCGERRTDE